MSFQRHFDSGVESFSAGRYDDAIREFSAALRLDPRSALSHYGLGLGLQAKGRTAEAVAALEDFIALAPADRRRELEDARRRVAALGPRGGGTLTLGPSAAPGKTTASAAAPAEGGAPGRLSWRPGDVIDGLYEVKSELGQGGFGSVHLVRHLDWGLDLAVKSPRPDRVANRRALENFVQEANTWVGLGLHPHIVACYFVRVIGMPRIFIEYMEGGSLADWLKKDKVRDVKDALDAAVQIARAMEYAHGRGLVHRDLKPGNCMMTPGGTLKVTDFGLAKVRGDDGPDAAETAPGAKIARVKGATQTGRLGTPEYMAPEQWQRPKEAGQAADAWAFGVMLYELCCGKKPFELVDDEPVDVFYARLLESGWSYEKPKGLPGGLPEFIETCLNADPGKRLADFKKIAAILEAAHEKVAGSPYPRRASRETSLPADTLMNQGVSMADLGRTEEASRLFDEALKLDPTHPGAIYNQGLLLLNAGTLSETELAARLLESKKTRPKDWTPGYLLGLVQLRRQDGPAAARELDEAAALSRDNALVLRAQRRASAGDYGGSAEVFVALPRGVEEAGLEEAAFKTLLSRAEHEWAAGEFGKSYGNVLKARGVKGYERAAAALEKIRALSGKGVRKGLRAAWQKRTLEGSEGARALAVAPDGAKLLVGHEDASLKLWDVASGERLRVFEGHGGAVNAVCVTPDGRCAVSAAADGTLRSWDLESGRCVRIFAGHAGPVRSAAVTPDGKRVLSGGDDLKLRLWELTREKRPKTFSEKMYSASVALDGKKALSGGAELRYWTLATGKEIAALNGHAGAVYFACPSPDGKRALSAGADKTLRFWDLETGSCLQTINGTDALSSACFTPEGRFVLTAGEGKAFKVWAFASGECAGSFEGHKERIEAACSSPDGNFAFTAGADGVRCWELDWDYDFPEPANWAEGAAPFAEAFLSLRAAGPPRPLTEEEARSLTAELGRRGYGWLKAEGVSAKLAALDRRNWGDEAKWRAIDALRSVAGLFPGWKDEA